MSRRQGFSPPQRSSDRGLPVARAMSRSALAASSVSLSSWVSGWADGASSQTPRRREYRCRAASVRVMTATCTVMPVRRRWVQRARCSSAQRRTRREAWAARQKSSGRLSGTPKAPAGSGTELMVRVAAGQADGPGGELSGESGLKSARRRSGSGRSEERGEPLLSIRARRGFGRGSSLGSRADGRATKRRLASGRASRVRSPGFSEF